mgnify:CR=1 FL=1
MVIKMNKNPDLEMAIQCTIDEMASSLFVIICNFYPDFSTSELEGIFNEQFKSQVLIFVNDYFNSVNKHTELRMTAKDITQVYTHKSFFEKLALVLERSDRIRFKRNNDKSKNSSNNKR